jgi:hypothetical protein
MPIETHLSAKPPSHRSETTIGSNISSLPEIVKPNGPLEDEAKQQKHFQTFFILFYFLTLVEVIELYKQQHFRIDYLQHKYHLF